MSLGVIVPGCTLRTPCRGYVGEALECKCVVCGLPAGGGRSSMTLGEGHYCSPCAESGAPERFGKRLDPSNMSGDDAREAGW